MKNLLKTVPFVALLALSGTAFAQTTETPDAEEEKPANALELSMGEEASDESKVGDIYVEAKHSDWEIRCFVTENGNDPCQLYQLLNDGSGNPVAEINVFILPEDQDAAAGATVITPLETLLTQQLSLSVDGGRAKKYPFSWCGAIGCFSRLGFSDGDIVALKKGVTATLTIVPVAAPEQKVNLQVSLKGFTAAYDAAAAKLK